MNCRSLSQRTNSGHVLLIHTLDGMGCEVSFLQDKLSSDRDFQKATVTLFFFNFFHILPRSSPMNHENVCPSYSFSCPMSRIHLGFCTFFLFEAFRPTITIVRVTSHHRTYNTTTTHTRVYVKTFPYHLIHPWEWKMILGIVARPHATLNDGRPQLSCDSE